MQALSGRLIAMCYFSAIFHFYVNPFSEIHYTTFYCFVNMKFITAAGCHAGNAQQNSEETLS